MAKKAAAAKSKPKSMTKSALHAELAEKAGITKKDVAGLFDALGEIIKRQLKKDGDSFTIPGLLKLRLRKVKAVKGGKVVPDPFNPGQTRVTKDRPARNVVRARALKGLTEMVQ